MARKDAEFVIRARDQAEGVIEKITKALNDLSGASGKVEGSAEKSDSALSKLGDTITQLDKVVTGLSIAGKLEDDLGKAAAAVARLEERLEGTQGDLAGLEQRMKGVEFQSASFAAKITGARDALVKQKAAVERAKADSKSLADAYEKAAAAQGKLAGRASELPGELAKQQAIVAATAQKFEELQAQLHGTEKPTTTLLREVDRTSTALKKQQGVLNALETEYADIGGALRAAGAAATLFGAESAAAAQDLVRQESILGKIEGNLKELGTAAKTAGRQENALAAEVEKASQRLVMQTADFERAENSMIELAAATGKIESQLKELGTVSLGRIENELVEQGLAAQKARVEYEALERAADAYAAQVGRAGVPTREMSQNLALIRQEADEAQFVFELQKETLENLGRAYAESDKSMDGLRATQARFVTEAERLDRALQEVANAGFQSRQGIRAVHQEADPTAAALRRVNNETRGASREAKEAAGRVGALGAAYRALYGDTRKSLSLTQRLRGEVLSLVAAYGGLYGIISLLRQTTEAYQTLEAAQARLNVSTGGNFEQTTQELDFVRRQADRLGIEFGTLANEYSKFAIATQNTNLEGRRTRDIFVAVAEAARVARTSNDELSAVFVALTQIVSKGAVQMEELRQQLGDRLPGALQLMADGLGVTTGQLIKMMEQGQITADALVPFAETLRERFGGELESTLAGTTVALGRLRNSAFQALVAFGQGGFTESLTNLANTLADLFDSADFQQFVQKISAGVATLLDVLAFLADHFQLVAGAAGALGGLILLRFGAPILRAAANFLGLSKATQQITAGMDAAAVAMKRTGAAATGASAGVARLAAGFRAFLATTGVGLAVVAVTTALATWESSADQATQALYDHQDVLDSVRNGYEEVNGAVEDWRENVNTMTEQAAAEHLRQMQEAFQEAIDSFNSAENRLGGEFATRFFGRNLGVGATREYVDAVDEVIRKMNEGELTVYQFQDALDDLAGQYRDQSAANFRYATELDTAASLIVTAYDAVDEAAKIVKARSGDVEEGQKAFDELGDTAEDSADGLEAVRQGSDEAAEALEAAAKSAETFTDSLRGILSEFPALERYFDELEEREAFAQLVRDAAQAAVEIINVKAAWEQFAGALSGTSLDGLLADFLFDLDEVLGKVHEIGGAFDTLFTGLGRFGDVLDGALGSGFFSELPAALAQGFIDGATDGLVASANLIKHFEGFSASAYFDVNAYRAGYGSDTVTAADGSVSRVNRGTTVTEEGALRDLSRRLLEFQGVIEDQIGAERFAAFSPEQQAALTSIAYNYGSLPERIVGAVREGSTEDITRAILSLQNDNDGVNRSRRNQEAALFQSGGAIDPQTAADVARAQQERQEATDETIAGLQEELRLGELIAEGREREATVQEALARAREENENITEAELNQVRALTEQLYDQEQAAEAREDAEQEAKKAAEEAAAARAATQDTLSDAEFELHLQDLKNQGLERQAEIEAALRDAKKADANITEEELQRLAELEGARYDAERAGRGESDALDAAEAAQERFNDLLAQRNALEEQRQQLLANGDVTAALEAQAQLDELNASLEEARQNAIAMWEAVGGTEAETAITTLENGRLEADGLVDAGRRTYLQWDQVAGMFVNGLAGAIDQWAQAVANGEDKWVAARQAFLQFASDFLIQIAQMILKQAIFNALQAAFGGTAFGGLIGLGTGHSGGIVSSSGHVGSGNYMTRVHPGVFATAQRFHEGGIVGLNPGEVPVIAQEGENIQTEDDPFHPNNLSKTLGSMGSSQPAGDTTIYNMVEGEAVMRAALHSDKGGRVLVNFIRDNAGTIKGILNG